MQEDGTLEAVVSDPAVLSALLGPVGVCLCLSPRLNTQRPHTAVAICVLDHPIKGVGCAPRSWVDRKG